ncbi:UDP-3-O-(3-hydroxymyristoyl)glucosamine N-acyltransferase [Maridesulfovibrio hydrothermalis]|uniref:UDP-3-O-acylglucosamine N-acyltransferase n=1 Tax=Maridesulfovibrio hydrothermalis AM13 = DSM 14728 TaxID=1121451 RepID=L0R771_9BACT|nr:UDP-3-O-(3-hydroxymyristoyl)glucosamine N-acyltransferase [Maridesulfovibrio hydrothermalis]CCO22040.1 UDP-3-O-[3-hydroxymyristoyl] glucosamine N-acyltransferase [Maridesulfovibrio hydrothermalis AM13 = DSM 14728]
MLLSELSGLIGLKLAGKDKEISGVNTLELAGPTELSFLANAKYEDKLSTTKAAAVVLEEKYTDQVESALISENPYMDLAKAMHVFSKPQGCLEGIHELAFVHNDADVDDTATVYPFAFIGKGTVVGPNCKVFAGAYVGEDCTIGAGSILYPNCTVMAATAIGAGVIVQPGAVIGGDGFGYAQVAGKHMKIPQIGTVELGDQVEVGANACIDRASLDVTRIGSGSKLDNLVQIAHNVTTGDDCLIISQSGVAGSTKLGKNVIIAAQAGLVDNIKIGDGAIIGAQAGVPNDVKPGFIGAGSPLQDQRSFLRSSVSIRKLPVMGKKISALEKRIKALEAELFKGNEDE